MMLLLLVDFGSAAEARSIKAYLRAIFSDPFIRGSRRISIPQKVTAYIMSQLFAPLSRRRSKITEGQTFPVKLRNELCTKLEAKIKIPTRWTTRYASPDIEESLGSLIRNGYRKIIVIPLFPHHSISMTESIVNECERVSNKIGANMVEMVYIKSWIDSPSWAEGWAKQIGSDIQPHILFSAHSIPRTHIARGCPYKREVERSVEIIKKELGPGPSFHLAYQSGRRSRGWLGPSIQEKLNDLLNQGVKDCAVVPLSFIFENVETLVDLDVDIIPKFQRLGMKGLKRVATPGSSVGIINTLAALTERFIRP